MENKFWDIYYKSNNVALPTEFCNFIDKKLLVNNSYEAIVELGCGNGRDSQLLASKTKKYIGLDASNEAIKKSVANNKTSNAKFYVSDFVDFDKYLPNSVTNLLVYSRFTIHSIDENSEIMLFNKIKNLDNINITVCIEVRTVYDNFFGIGSKISEFEYFSDHYRRFIHPNNFINNINSKFNIKYIDLDKNNAIYKNENPIVLRCIFDK
jgi:predicted TPR repeat methyltransferase